MPRDRRDDAPAFIIVFNRASGHGDADAVRDIITRVLDEAGCRHELVVPEHPSRIVEAARAAVLRAKACGAVVVAAGGDGTLNAVAQQVLGSGCVFGALPLGTFNYFGRVQGIPVDTAEAVRVLLTGEAQPVQVGLVNDKLFLVNASLGLYPQLLEDREAFKKQFGRSRWVALGAAFATLMGRHRQLRLVIEAAGDTRALRTPTLFIGNNALQMEQLGLPEARDIEQGHLAAVALRPVGTAAMLWLMLRGAMGRLGEAENIISFAFRRITVTPVLRAGRRRLKVATDGEVNWLSGPLTFRVSPEPLMLLKPKVGAGE